MDLGISQITVQFPAPIFITLLLLILSVAAIILAVVSLAVVFSLKKALVASIRPVFEEKETEQSSVVEKPRKEAVEEIPEKGEVEEGKIPEIKVSPSRVATLRELASNLNLNAILFFNLAGLPIESYNIRDAHNIAASLAEFIHTLRRFGFPDNVIKVSNGVNVYILLVKKIEDLEIYALVVGDTGLEMRDLKNVLNQLLESLLGEEA